MWKKIYSLTKVFLKDTYQNFKIFNNKTRKIEKKSVFFWMILIIFLSISFISYKIINLLMSAGQPQIFLDIYFVIVAIIIMFQTVLIATNVLFFSKEFEYILPMPITPLELLLSKLGVFVVMAYITEGVMAVSPFIIYGLMTHISFVYFIALPIVLIVFPIIFVCIISLATILLMTFSRFIKNKNAYQTFITICLLSIVVIFEVVTMNQLKNQNFDSKEQTQRNIEICRHFGDGYLVVIPSIEILSNPNKINTLILNLGKLLTYDLVAILFYLFIGKTVYLQNILLGRISKIKSKIFVMKSKKKSSIGKAYIKKELKQLYRNPSFFIQLLFPVTLLIISLFIVASVLIPIINNIIQNNPDIKNELDQLTFNSEIISVFFCILEFLFSMSGISLTAISREGKSAFLVKYIPVDLYKQFLYKNTIEVVFNLIISVLMVGIMKILIPEVNLLEAILIFINLIFVILINSFIMLIVDLERPMLNWDSETMLIKKNPNKIFQYVFMIIMILIFLYLGKIFKDTNLCIALVAQIVLFFITFIVINYFVKKNCKKIFRNII